MTEVETTWILQADTATGRVRFEVEYHSTLPPSRHEDVHRALRAEASKLLERLLEEHPTWGRGACVAMKHAQTGVTTVENVETRTRTEEP